MKRTFTIIACVVLALGASVAFLSMTAEDTHGTNYLIAYPEGPRCDAPPTPEICT